MVAVSTVRTENAQGHFTLAWDKGWACALPSLPGRGAGGKGPGPRILRADGSMRVLPSPQTPLPAGEGLCITPACNVPAETAIGHQPAHRHGNMIHAIRIRGFKRLGREVEFRLPGHVVLTGPNNTGKTTVLQAIASWALALRRWRELNDFNPRQGYTYAPIARQAFTAVPLRSFDLMWTNRLYHRNNPIEIELRHSDGWSLTMELVADSTEQIYVRPTWGAPSDVLRNLDLHVAFIPPDDRNRDRRTGVPATEDRTASRPRPSGRGAPQPAGRGESRRVSVGRTSSVHRKAVQLQAPAA